MTKTEGGGRRSSPRAPRQVEIARLAGVSPATVSKVLNGGSGVGQTLRDKVFTAMQALGLYPEDLRRRLGAVPATLKLITYQEYLAFEGSYFHAEIIRSVMVECAQHGIRVETVLLNRNGQNDLIEYRRRLSEGALEAALLVGLDAPEFLAPLRGKGRAVVIINGSDPAASFDSISPAWRHGSFLAAQHLITCGHREIIHVTHLFRRMIHERLGGFRDALEQAGIAFDPDRHVLNVGTAYFSTEPAALLIERRIRAGQLKATGLHCASDYTAVGALQGIQRAGRRVPDDYSVVSFDNLAIAESSHPPLTAAGIDRTHLGRLAIKRLIERYQSPGEAVQRVELMAHLSNRASVRVINASD